MEWFRICLIWLLLILSWFPDQFTLFVLLDFFGCLVHPFFIEVLNANVPFLCSALLLISFWKILATNSKRVTVEFSGYFFFSFFCCSGQQLHGLEISPFLVG